VDKSLKVTFKDTTYMPLGVYIANSPYAYHENNGNVTGYGRALNQEGDFFKLTFHGLDADNNETGTTVEHFLAKFEDGVLKQSNKWEWVDLSALGKISSFYCTLSSSDNDTYGMKTAAYFCMDKLQVAKPKSVRNEQAIAASQVKVYPTATSDLLYISAANGVAPAGSKAMIYDIQGRKLQEVSLSSSTTKIDISNYNTGMYLIKVGNKTVKVIKQ
jgi:S-ribosylhomocysteine lyase LuxS involved in autoinducer biosynthesis